MSTDFGMKFRLSAVFHHVCRKSLFDLGNAKALFASTPRRRSNRTLAVSTYSPPRLSRALSRDPRDFNLATIVDGLSGKSLQTPRFYDCWIGYVNRLRLEHSYNITATNNVGHKTMQ